jgi:uncharacterized membrane protein
MSQEQHKRSIVKAVTFRVIIMASDFVIIALITHRYDVALGVIIASNIASTIFYYLHERAWDKISWGRQ